MNKELDCRGLTCPAPVLQVREILNNAEPAAITVLVDNEAARQNVCRFLEYQNYTVSSVVDGNEFRIFGAKGVLPSDSELLVHAPASTQPLTSAKKIMVLISGTHMGHGDDGLGDMLMYNFLKTLKEMLPELWQVVFVNSGVTFTAEGSEAVPILQELATEGVQIRSCGACLAFFHILDKMQVGEVTNMLEIVTGMQSADTVITL